MRLTLPARPENVAVIRHVLGAFAEALELPAALIEDMRLAITEACTNVVRHAYHDGEAGPIDVVIRPGDDRLELVVSDRGRGIGPSPDVTGPGLGLPLIAALTDSLEVQRGPRRGSRLAMSWDCRARRGAARTTHRDPRSASPDGERGSAGTTHRDPRSASPDGERGSA